MPASDDKKPSIEFTMDELRAIHHTLHTIPWQMEHLYNPRAAARKKLEAFFGDDNDHLRPRKSSEGGYTP